MNIILYRTTKRDNSTATPVSAPAMFTNRIEKDVRLKETTDVLNPTFILNQHGHDGQNYVWAFGRYYWVTGIKYLANELMEIACKVDPLGSYRGHIRNTQAFVLYDSSPNSEIPDKRLGIRTTATYQYTTADMPWNFGQTTRFIALSGDKNADLNSGATGIYAVTQAGIDDLGFDFADDFDEIKNKAAVDSGYDAVMTELANIMLWQSSTVEEWLSKMVNIVFVFFESLGPAFLYCVLVVFHWLKALFVGGKALENVKSAWWLPFGDVAEGTTYSKLTLGGWTEEISGGAIKITNPIKSTVVPIRIPWQFSDWRNVSNTEIQLYIPSIGVINIPSSSVKGVNQLNIWFCLNMYSGQLSVRVLGGSSITVGTYGSCVASPILFGDSNVNMSQITNTIAAGASVGIGIATGTAAITAGGVMSGISSGFESLSPINTSVGGIGGGTASGLGTSIWLSLIIHNTSDNPADLLPIIGTPTNVLKTLNGSGFCQTMQAHLNMNAVTGESYPTESEVELVNSLLNSGVYLE